MLHLYFNENSDYSEENTCENKSFVSPQKETKHIHTSAADLLHTVLEQEISIGANARNNPTVGVLRKRVFFKISQNSQETPVPEETPVNFTKFLRTPFLQNISRRLLLKADIAIAKGEIQIVFVVESWMQCLLLRLKSQSAREEFHHPAFMGICPTISQRISLIYLSSSFGSQCSRTKPEGWVNISFRMRKGGESP